MPISIAQFNQLAEHFGFDVNDAREFLGLPTTGKRGRPTKVCSGGSCKTVMVVPKEKKSKSEKPTDVKRRVTGYQLFMKDNIAKITNKLKTQHGDKLPRGAVLSAVGIEWKLLSENKRSSWNSKAAGM